MVSISARCVLSDDIRIKTSVAREDIKRDTPIASERVPISSRRVMKIVIIIMLCARVRGRDASVKTFSVRESLADGTAEKGFLTLHRRHRRRRFGSTRRVNTSLCLITCATAPCCPFVVPLARSVPSLISKTIRAAKNVFAHSARAEKPARNKTLKRFKEARARFRLATLCDNYVYEILVYLFVFFFTSASFERNDIKGRW